jgi:FkbM family methyltransferase
VILDGDQKMNRAVNRFLRARLSSGAYSAIRRLADLLIAYRRESYSQFGEDLFLAERFKDRNDGFFVDVGAYHPRQLSNTHALYRRGWRGINIDATPGSSKLFKMLRPRDINVEAAVSRSSGPMEFCSWGLNAENTAYQPQIDGVSAVHGAGIIAKLTAVSLKELLEQLPERPERIDLLNIDVEGLDFDVLQSFDWQTYRPTIVIVEQFSHTITQVLATELYEFMITMDYRLASWHRPSLIFELSPRPNGQ